MTVQEFLNEVHEELVSGAPGQYAVTVSIPQPNGTLTRWTSQVTVK